MQHKPTRIMLSTRPTQTATNTRHRTSAVFQKLAVYLDVTIVGTGEAMAAIDAAAVGMIVVEDTSTTETNWERRNNVLSVDYFRLS